MQTIRKVKFSKRDEPDCLKKFKWSTENNLTRHYRKWITLTLVLVFCFYEWMKKREPLKSSIEIILARGLLCVKLGVWGGGRIAVYKQAEDFARAFPAHFLHPSPLLLQNSYSSSSEDIVQRAFHGKGDIYLVAMFFSCSVKYLTKIKQGHQRNVKLSIIF